MPRGWKDIPPGPGRPKGSKNAAPIHFAEYVRNQTHQGEDPVKVALEILHNKIELPRKYDAVRWHQLRLDAARWLADRGFGKAKEIIEIEGEAVAPVSFDGLSLEELKTLRALAAKARKD